MGVQAQKARLNPDARRRDRGCKRSDRLRGDPAAGHSSRPTWPSRARPKLGGSRSGARWGRSPKPAAVRPPSRMKPDRSPRTARGGKRRREDGGAQRRPPGVAPVGAAKAAGPSATAGQPPDRVKPDAKADGENPQGLMRGSPDVSRATDSRAVIQTARTHNAGPRVTWPVEGLHSSYAGAGRDRLRRLLRRPGSRPRGTPWPEPLGPTKPSAAPCSA